MRPGLQPEPHSWRCPSHLPVASTLAAHDLPDSNRIAVVALEILVAPKFLMEPSAYDHCQ